MVKISDELAAVKELIKDRRYWCKGAMAKTRFFGRIVSVNSSWAYKHCLVGAIVKVVGEDSFPSEGTMFLHNMVSYSLVALNDTQGYDAVMELLNRGIELALAKEKEERLS